MALLLSALLAGCGGGTDPTTTVSGTAASGAPINGGTVQMVCASSTPGTAVTTGTDGGFTVTAPGNAPCVIRVSGGNIVGGGPLISVVASSAQTRANVNQLTHMLAFLLSGGNPDTGLFQSPSSISSKITTTAVAMHKATIIANVIANLGTAVGIPTSFDFLEGTFTANGSGFDRLLDNVSFTSVGSTASIVFKGTGGGTLLAVNATTGVASTTSSTVISATSLLAAAGTPVVPGTVLPGAAGTAGAAATNPTVGSSNPSNSATNVPTSTNNTGTVVTVKLLTATFSEAMDSATILAAGTFTVTCAAPCVSPVTGMVTYDGPSRTATFTPAAALTPNSTYIATVTTAAKNAGGTAIPATVAWSFTTNAVALTGQAPVNLGAAGTFAILTKTGISTTGTTLVTGDIGVSPAAASTITGFALSAPPTTFSTSARVVGQVFAADYNPPTPANMTTAVANMEAAYTAAAGRTAGVGPFLNRGGGTLTGLTLAPGVYTWGTNVTIPTDLTLSGGANDVWIFQITGTLNLEAGKQVFLAGGAQAKNIFWQVSQAVTLKPDSHFEGIILAQTLIAMQTNASTNGRLLAQAAATLQGNPVKQPAP